MRAVLGGKRWARVGHVMRLPGRAQLVPRIPLRARTLACASLRPPSRRADHMGMAAPTYYTADMVRALPDDGKRYETVHGELLVTPSPGVAHQWVISRLLERLFPYLATYPRWRLLTSPADISWAPDVLVQPDIFVVPAEELSSLAWASVRTLPLTIEVLSPSTRRYDRFTKRLAYQEYGVTVYWIVDIVGRAVEVWTPGAAFPSVERERVVWQVPGGAEPLVLPLSAVFADL